MLLHWRLHMVLGFQALTQSLARQTATGQTRSLIVTEDSWWHYYPDRAVRFFCLFVFVLLIKVLFFSFFFFCHSI